MSKEKSCEPEMVVSEIQTLIPSAKKKNDTTGELIVNLPDTSVDKFPQLFDALGRRKDSLGIINFGMNVTTMEDVFLRFVL